MPDTKTTLALSLHDVMGGGDLRRAGTSTDDLRKQQRAPDALEQQRSRALSIDVPPPMYSAVSPESEHAAALALERQLQDAHEGAQLLARHLHEAEDEALAAMLAVQAQVTTSEARAAEAERAVQEQSARAASAEDRARAAEMRADAAEARLRDRDVYVESLEFIVSKLCRSIDEHVTGIPAPAGKRK
ncbi:hypothetical protein HDZ31DRAFT_66412 [Schizophyllum fasciatum]